jgi:signal peptidase I
MNIKSFLREAVITIVVALLLYFVLQATVQKSIVNGYSMETTLDNGQQVLINKVVYHLHTPQRGDIIIFHPPQQPSYSLPYIKRVIGLPGETIEIKNDIVYINGQGLEEPYINDPPHYTMLPVTVPDGSYFVLGDNRNNSSDSHGGWTVPQQNIIGKAWLLIWPPGTWGLAPNYGFIND